MKPINRQLVIAVIILISVFVISFGIRQIRLNIHRAGRVEEPAVSGRFSKSEEQSPLKQSFWPRSEIDYSTNDSYTSDHGYDLEYADESDWDEQEAPDDYSKEHTNSIKHDKVVSKAKSLKGDYTSAEKKNGLQKISLGGHESLYRTEKGDLWYVSKEADGSITKMQVKVDDSGDMIVVDGGNYGESAGAKSLQRIPVGEYENIYITGEGGLWYTSEQPDGSIAKVQFQEDVEGEIIIVDNGKDGQ